MVRAFVLAFVATVVSGCMSNHTEHMQDVNPIGWHMGEGVAIIVDNRDTLSLFNLSLLLRWDDHFAQRSLPCTIVTTAPDSTSFTEEIIFDMRRGKILKHSTGYRDSEIDYRQGVRLSQSGVYRFRIEPAQSDEPVVGVWAVGINISK